MRVRKSKKARTLGDIGERGFIKKILPSSKGSPRRAFFIPPGDDAVVMKNPGRSVLSIDGITEGTHFRSAWAQRCESLGGFSLGRALGWKVMGASLSDLAAMGGTKNRWAMVYLGAPGATDIPFLSELQRGTREAAKKFQCALAGGDTVKAYQLSLVAAVGGDLVGPRALTRSGAQPGDLICVAGKVGDASLGLRLLEGKLKIHSKADAAYFVRRFFEHAPMFEAGAALAAEPGVTSAMDLSDALKDSIEILCEASGTGARVRIESVPMSPAYRRYRGPSAEILTGGEDYALLFTLRAVALSRLRREIPFTVIGHMVPKKQGLAYSSNGKTIPEPQSFQHFG